MPESNMPSLGLENINWSEVDLDVLAKSIGKPLLEALKPIVKPAVKETVADLQEFGKHIAQDMVNAMRSGNPQIEEELMEQARLLAEILGLRAEGISWSAFETVIKIVFQAAVAAVIAVGPKL
jgi:hypothetical protein